MKGIADLAVLQPCLENLAGDVDVAFLQQNDLGFRV